MTQGYQFDFSTPGIYQFSGGLILEDVTAMDKEALDLKTSKAPQDDSPPPPSAP